MGKINTTNYPNRPVSSYQDDDMFILQDNGGETYTTNVGDIKDLIGDETDPKLALKVDKNGTDRLMTTSEGTKLEGIAAGAQVNVLEGVQVNGTNLPITNKKVNVDISGKTDLEVIAYQFNEMMGYFKGAYVTYNGKLYEFIQEHTGAWNPSHVREVKAVGQYVRAGNGGYNNGDRATCEGYNTKASGNYSHAEGRETQAVGECTHAEGRGTIANSIYQHVEGKYNVADNESKYIHIIGNGIDANNRNNAFTVDWDGNLEVSGEVEDGNGEKISDKANDSAVVHKTGDETISGNKTFSGIVESENITEIENAMSSMIKTTQAGNPVVIETEYAQKAKAFELLATATQDLHGYDKPWAGGANVNLYDCTIIESTTFDVIFSNVSDADGNKLGVKAKGLSSGYAQYNVDCFLKAGTYKTFATGISNNFSFNVRNANGSWLAEPGDSFTLAEDTTIKIRYFVNEGLNADDIIYCMVYKYSGTDVTTFAPYSNICPIVGFSEKNVERTGKNLFDKDHINSFSGFIEIVSHKFKEAYEYKIAYISCMPNTTYTISKEAGKTFRVADSASIPADGVEYISTDANHTGTSITFTTSAIANYLAVLYWSSANQDILTPEELAATLQIELGSEPTPYEPYTGTDYTISFGDTVYGVKVTEQGCEVTYAMDEFDGSEDEVWAGTSSNGYYIQRVDFVKLQDYTNAIKCDKFKTIANNYTADRGITGYADSAGTYSSNWIYIKDSEIADVNILRDFLSTNPIQVTYKLKNPIPLTISPVTLALLAGTNVITTDGDSIKVTYRDGVVATLDDIVAEDERVDAKLAEGLGTKAEKTYLADIEGDTASRAYSVNDFMVRSDGLYKVTANIASGASITSSNTTKVTVGEVLTALLNA